ncbi:MAG: ROK family protein, partial [Actinobacteria bacterium]|nr:ROK family protein [Actinomycetota bacterium]
GADAARSGNFDAGVELAGAARAVTGVHVAAALADGDRQAANILDLFCANVAVGLANLVMVLDPARIVIAGGVCEIGEPLRAGIDAALIDATLGAAHRPKVEVVLAVLGSRAGAIGASLLAAEIDATG